MKQKFEGNTVYTFIIIYIHYRIGSARGSSLYVIIKEKN